MAKRGTKLYRKAQAYASRKWDLSEGKIKESGNTMDDVIEYVRKEMYKSSLSINEDVEGEVQQESEYIEEDKDEDDCEKDGDSGIEYNESTDNMK